MAITLKKKKALAPTAPKAPVKVKTSAGGVMAPKGSSRSATTGLGKAVSPPPRRGLGGNQKVPQPQSQQAASPAPGPSALPAGIGPPPSSMSTMEKRMYADQELGRVKGDVGKDLYLAALAYGDPDVIKLYGDVVPTPTGALQVAAREGEENRKANVLTHNARNTFFSGMNLEDIRKISDAESFKKKDALDAWNKASTDLNRILAEAEEVRSRLLSEADREDMEAFEASQPEPQAEAPPPAPAPGAAGGGRVAVGNAKALPAPKIGVGQAQALKKKKGK